MNAVGGEEALAVAAGARKVARDLEKSGINQVAAGTEEVGQAEALSAVAGALDVAAH